MSTRVLAPGYSLVNWGGDLTGFFPERYFLGFDDAGRGLAVAILLIRSGSCSRCAARRATSAGASASIVAFGVLAALFFRPREYGWYFHFKALAFVAPARRDASPRSGWRG